MIHHARPFAVHRQLGYTLIELMISLVIGATLIGAVLMAVSGTGLTGRRQDSMAALAEDGQVALNILASQLRMAGMWTPASPMASLEPNQLTLFGCRNGFANPAAATIAALAPCPAGVGNDAVAVRYNAIEPGGAPIVDCLGAAIPAGAGGWVDNRFYIANNPASGNLALYCRGNGGGTPQALIDNVESMQLRYGVAAIAAPPAGPILFDPAPYTGATVEYLRADALTSACSSAAVVNDSWCAVTTIRICLIVRSADNAVDAGTQYVDCDNNPITPADRRLRRAMTTTVSLRNRTAVAPAPAAP